MALERAVGCGLFRPLQPAAFGKWRPMRRLVAAMFSTRVKRFTDVGGWPAYDRMQK